MSYKDAEEALERVPEELRNKIKARIVKYANGPRKNDEVNSRNAAGTALGWKGIGDDFQNYTTPYQRQAMGILIKEALEDDLNWSSEKIPGEDESRSYRIYTPPK